jgi:pimeloyl-ACP methyl ester carboxylesterase
MQNLRIYGSPPYRVALLHGGPGAPGYMAPVARELASDRGILEPLQTADSISGQIEELRTLLVQHATLPVTLVGSSWGAMLGFIFAAHYPALVGKLILVGSGVYEDRYAANIHATRLSRLTPDEQAQADAWTAALADPASDKNALLAQLGALWTKTDAYAPLTLESEVLEHQYELHCRVWDEAAALRRTGRLLELGRQIECPVLAIHGDHDPHPEQGVREPLATVLKAFRFVLLPRCGHLPWLEQHARARFYSLLRAELP